MCHSAGRERAGKSQNQWCMRWIKVGDYQFILHPRFDRYILGIRPTYKNPYQPRGKHEHNIVFYGERNKNYATYENCVQHRVHRHANYSQQCVTAIPPVNVSNITSHELSSAKYVCHVDPRIFYEDSSPCCSIACPPLDRIPLLLTSPMSSAFLFSAVHSPVQFSMFPCRMGAWKKMDTPTRPE